MTDPTPMESLLTQLGLIFTQLMSWVGSVVSTIVAQPYLLLVTGIMITGAVFGLLARLIRRS